MEISVKGNQFTEQIEFKGTDPRRHTFSDDELEEKFEYLAGLALSKEKVERLVQLLEGLENLEGIDELAKLLY